RPAIPFILLCDRDSLGPLPAVAALSFLGMTLNVYIHFASLTDVFGDDLRKPVVRKIPTASYDREIFLIHPHQMIGHRESDARHDNRSYLGASLRNCLKCVVNTLHALVVLKIIRLKILPAGHYKRHA